MATLGGGFPAFGIGAILIMKWAGIGAMFTISMGHGMGQPANA